MILSSTGCVPSGKKGRDPNLPATFKKIIVHLFFVVDFIDLRFPLSAKKKF
jgi:hypothetical protein